jgi:anti-sigma B factor antagonist
MTEFTCRARNSGGTIVIVASGDLDIATRSGLISAVTPWLAPGAHVILNCAGITFMDSRGMQALLQLRRTAAQNGAWFGLADVPHAVSRIFKLAGVEHFFTTEVLPAA